MSDPTLDSIYSNIQIELAKTLLKRVKDGSATAADLNVARQLLKDNGIQAARPQANPALDMLAHVPFPVKPGEALA